MGIPAEGAFVLTLMGSLTRLLDQGLSFPVVVENNEGSSKKFSCGLCGMSRNDSASHPPVADVA